MTTSTANADLVAARDQVAKLLATAGIVRVVCVDDTFVADLGIVLDGIARTGPEIQRRVAELAGVDLGEDRAVWEPDLTDRWEDMDAAGQRLFASSVLAITGEEEQPDAGLLAALLPPGVGFIGITADEWREEFAAEVIDGAGTLVLFDRDHGSASENLGLTLTSQLFEADTSGKVWAGLLTHTVNPDTELEQAAELAAEFGIAPDRFVVISKQHLDAVPNTFPHSLKVTLMAPSAHRLREAVQKSISSSLMAAERDLALDPYIFERVVFGTSKTEGIWEPDTLLRLFNVIIRGHARRALHDSDEVRSETAQLREFSEVNLWPNKNPSFDRAQRIRHQEIYEDLDHLNRMHLPIELGDLFETDSSNARTYVLVEQPCDLMVRSQKGAGTRSNGISCGHLIEVRADEPGPRCDYFPLPAFDGGKPWFAYFAKSCIVPLEVLDFCVFNSNGCASLDVSAAASGRLWPAWMARHKILVRHATKLVEALASPQMSKAKREGIARAHYTARSPLQVAVVGQTVAFPIRRIGRLLPPYNRALLTNYSAHRARAAFEPDFTTSLLPTQE